MGWGGVCFPTWWASEWHRGSSFRQPREFSLPLAIMDRTGIPANLVCHYGYLIRDQVQYARLCVLVLVEGFLSTLTLTSHMTTWRLKTSLALVALRLECTSGLIQKSLPT